jgi:hypothetical protein
MYRYDTVSRRRGRRVIAGFGRDANEIYDLLGFYSAWSGSSLKMLRNNLSVPSFRVTLHYVKFQTSADLRRGISYIKYDERMTTWIGHILHRKCLLKQVTQWKIKGRTDVKERGGRRRIYWMTLRKREVTATGNMTHWISLLGKLTLDEAMVLS